MLWRNAYGDRTRQRQRLMELRLIGYQVENGKVILRVGQVGRVQTILKW